MALDLDINIRALGSLSSTFSGVVASLKQVEGKIRKAAGSLKSSAAAMEKAALAMSEASINLRTALALQTKADRKAERAKKRALKIVERMAEKETSGAKTRTQEAKKQTREVRRQVRLQTGLFQMARLVDLGQRSATRFRTDGSKMLVGGIAGMAALGAGRGLLRIQDNATLRDNRILTTLQSNYDNIPTRDAAREWLPTVRAEAIKYANATPGSESDFLSGMERLIPVTGQNLKDLMRTVQYSMIAGARNRPEGASLILGDLLQALDGNISARQTKDLFDFIRATNPGGKSPEQLWNHLSYNEKLDLYYASLEKIADEVDAALDTFQAQATTLGSFATRFAEIAGKEFSSQAVGVLKSMNAMFARHGDNIARFLAGASPALAAGGKVGLGSIMAAGSATAGLSVLGSGLALGGVTTGLVGGIGGAFAAAAPAAAAASVAGAVAAVTALGAVVAALGSAAFVAASVLKVLTRGVSVTWEQVGRMFEHGFIAMVQVVRSAFTSFFAVMDIVGNLVMVFITPVLALNSAFAQVTGTVIDFEKTMTQAFNLLAYLGSSLEFMLLSTLRGWLTVRGDAKGATKARIMAQNASTRRAVDWWYLQTGNQRFYGGEATLLKDLREALAQVAEASGGLGGSNTFIDKVEVEIKAETMDDPLRVAATIDDVLATIQRRRRGATVAWRNP